MSAPEFPMEKCFEYVPIEELDKYINKVTDFEKIALQCCVARKKARGRPSFGKDKPLCYALLVYLRDVRGFPLRELPRVISELMDKYGISGPKPALGTLEDRFEELKKSRELQEYVSKVLAWLRELGKKGKRKILLIDRKLVEKAIEAWRQGNRELAKELLSKATEWEPLRIRLLNLFERARPTAWRSEANEVARYAAVVLLGWGMKELEELKELKRRLPDRIIVAEEELEKVFCNPESFFKYRDDLLSYGYARDTVRKIVTTLKEVCGKEVESKLKGMHGELHIRGLRKGDAHVIFPQEFRWLMQHPDLTWEEKLILKLHVTLGCREGGEFTYYAPGKKAMGGLLGLRWENVKWEGGLPKRIDVLETKTEKGRKEGTWWLNCPIDLFFPELPQELKEYWEKLGKPREGYIFYPRWTRSKLQTLYRKVRRLLKQYRMECMEGKRAAEECPTTAEPKITPHDARRTHALWLVLADVPLEVIAGTGLGRPIIEAPLGVAWKDLTVMMSYYQDLSRKAKKYVGVVKEWARKVFG